MKKSTAILGALVLSTSLAAAGVVSAHSVNNQSPSTPGAENMGPGMMGNNLMPQNKSAGPGNMMGSSMMGRNLGYGMMMGHRSHHFQTSTVERNFSADDVRKILDGHLVWMGHKRLKVGDVKAQDDGTLLADINTVDGSLAMRMEVDPKTGAMHMTNE